MRREYAALLDYADEVRGGIMTVGEASKRCFQQRERDMADLRARGIRFGKGTMREALRAYGLHCTVYYLYT